MPHRDERARLSPQRTSNHALPTPNLDDSERYEPRQSYIGELAPPLPELSPPQLAVVPCSPSPLLSEAKTSSLPPQAAARRLVTALLARGVDMFFGIPGGPVCPIFEAIRLDERARLIESRHETHAAFAAALYYRATGRVPAVVVTAGPGITNAITGIASASLERTPMLVLAGDVAWATSGNVLLQDSGPEGIDMEAMLMPITRAQLRAAHARSVVGQALSALDIATDPRNPGPVLFALPLDHAMDSCDELEVVAPARPVSPLGPPRVVLARTRAWLTEATRPLIVLGGGCRGHEPAIRELIAAAGVPFVTTPRAKGIVSEQHPLSLRNGGMAASLWARRYTAEPVDFCLVLGTDLDDVSTGPTRYVGASGRVVHVDLNARVFGRNLPTALAVTCELGSFATALARTLGKEQARNPLVMKALAEAKADSAFDVANAADDDATPIRPHRLLAELEAAVSPRTRFVTDIGEHMLFCLHYLTARDSDAFHVQLSLGSMGSGIAGAIGLALADRTRRVVCIAGDGGMQMSGMEALVAVRERLPILFVVFNDGRYNMVHHGMRQIFGEANAYDTPHVDFFAWAKSIGMPSRVITQPGAISRLSVDALLAHGGPALIDARIDANVRIRGGGRVEALQHMSMLSQSRGERS